MYIPVKGRTTGSLIIVFFYAPSCSPNTTIKPTLAFMRFSLGRMTGGRPYVLQSTSVAYLGGKLMGDENTFQNRMPRYCIFGGVSHENHLVELSNWLVDDDLCPPREPNSGAILVELQHAMVTTRSWIKINQSHFFREHETRFSPWFSPGFSP